MVLKYNNIFHTLRSKLGIKDSEGHLVIDMQSKLSRNSSSGVRESSGFETHNNKSTTKKIITQRMKDTSRKANLKIFSPRSMKTRVTRSLIKTLESGVSSTKSPRTTPMDVTQNIHWWSRSKKKN
jgi:hypothetical protein